MICRARFKSRYVMAVYCVFMRLALLPRVGMVIKNSKAWNNVCYLIRGIAKRLYSDIQSTPTPHRYLDSPCRGVDIRQA